MHTDVHGLGFRSLRVQIPNPQQLSLRKEDLAETRSYLTHTIAGEKEDLCRSIYAYIGHLELNYMLGISECRASGPKVCKYYLHWAIWIPRVRV